jgi:hypothetical protein
MDSLLVCGSGGLRLHHVGAFLLRDRPGLPGLRGLRRGPVRPGRKPSQRLRRVRPGARGDLRRFRGQRLRRPHRRGMLRALRRDCLRSAPGGLPRRRGHLLQRCVHLPAQARGDRLRRRGRVHRRGRVLPGRLPGHARHLRHPAAQRVHRRLHHAQLRRRGELHRGQLLLRLPGCQLPKRLRRRGLRGRSLRGSGLRSAPGALLRKRGSLLQGLLQLPPALRRDRLRRRTVLHRRRRLPERRLSGLAGDL